MRHIYTDTETTGLEPPLARVIEIGWAEVPEMIPEAFDEMRVHEFRVTPTQDILLRASPKALEVNGYYSGHPDWEGTPYVGTDEAAALWGRVAEAFEGARMVNQNIAFDLKFIEHELRVHGLLRPGAFGIAPPPWDKERICTRPMATRICDAARLEGLTRSLHPIYDYLEGPKLPPHRAVADVLRAIWLHACYLERYAEMNTQRMKDAVLRYRAERFTEPSC